MTAAFEKEVANMTIRSKYLSAYERIVRRGETLVRVGSR
jgi:hypothetical protein